MNKSSLKKRLVMFAAMLVAAATLGSVRAIETLGDTQRNALLKPVVESYSNWSRVELNGKLRADMLPVSASVKIYMERNKQLLMSVRAPLVGEAARIEITSDSLLVVNKLKRVYCSVGMDMVNRIYPGALPDLQALLLRRMAIMGQGEMSKRSISNVDVYAAGAGSGSQLLVVPRPAWQPEGMLYGYTLSAAGALVNMILVGDDSDSMVELAYSSQGSSTVIDASMTWGKRNFSASFTVDSPKWGAAPFDRFKPNSRFRRVSLRDVLSF